MQDIGLAVNATTVDNTEKVLIAATMTILFASANDVMSFRLFRGSEDLLGIPIMILRSEGTTNEYVPACITYVDAPGAAQKALYSLKVSGTGVISPATRYRVFLTVVVKSATALVTSGTVAPPSTTLSLGKYSPMLSTSDSVLALMTMSASNLTKIVDFELQFSRGPTRTGTFASFGGAPRGIVSTSLGVIDNPVASGSASYTVAVARGTGSTAEFTKQGQARVISLVSVPTALVSESSTSSSVSVTSTAWTTLLTVQARTTSASDTVLLMFSADLTFSFGTYTTACLTVFRNETNLGSATTGLLTIANAMTSGARRSPMMICLSAPGGAGTHSFSVRVLTPQGNQFVLGSSGRASTLSAIVVTETPLPPTAAPSVAPSTLVPTLTPTQPPTASPVSLYDCRDTCTFLSTAVPIVAGSLRARVRFPPSAFVMSFDVGGVALGEAPGGANGILQIVRESGSYHFLSVLTTSTRGLRIRYNNADVVDGTGPMLQTDYATAFTSITIAVNNNELKVFTSSAVTTFTYPVTMANTTSFVYAMYASAWAPASGGQIRSMSISGELSYIATRPFSLCYLSLLWYSAWRTHGGPHALAHPVLCANNRAVTTQKYNTV
jgi:hypothetical protein